MIADTNKESIRPAHRVLRRVLQLFVIAVLLPIGLGAVVSFYQVEKSLEEQSYLRSYDASRFHGTVVLENLLKAQRELDTVLARIENTGFSETIETTFASDLLLISQGQPPQAITGDQPVEGFPLEKLTFNGSGRPAIYIGERDGAIFMAVKSPPLSERNQILLGRLNKPMIFGNEHEQLLYAQLCIFQANKALYCTSELATEKDLIQSHLTRPLAERRLNWQTRENTRMLASVRDLFLPSHFESSIWQVVVAESETLVYAPVSVFRWLFPALTALSILSMLFLVVTQTRRHLSPLSKLQENARKLGGGDFDARISLNTQDEFEALGDSFNDMADKLGTQFNFLEVMAEIDTVMLASADLAGVCKTILDNVPKILPTSGLAVLTLNQARESSGRLFYRSWNDSKTIEYNDKRVEKNFLLRLQQNPEAFFVEDKQEATALFGGLDLAPEDHNTRTLIHPLYFEGKLLGALCLAFSESTELTADYEGRISSITDRTTLALSAVERQERLYKQAHFDELTGLPNRQLFMDRLEQCLAKAEREKSHVAVLYADLDRFKSINDTMGHAYGDLALKQAATRFSRLIRGSDTLARLSGDEFVFAIPDLKEPRDVMQVVQTIMNDFNTPFQLNQQEFVLGLSIGIAVAPESGDSAENLVKNADIAMYRAKGNPTTAFKFFEESMNAEIRERSSLAQDLLQAVRDKKLELVYQPKVHTQTHKIASAEALIRWKHPKLGYISPAKFIPIAEETGLIPQIGEFALNTACEQFAQWRRQGLPISQVAVNVSPRQIQYTDLVEVVESILERTAIPASCLELEITEDLLIEDYQKTEEMLSRLGKLGVGLALDDFGTGYSSLSHLHELSFDTLKIDKCFIDNLGTTDNSDAIVRSIIALGKSLDKKLVGEGVENEHQLRFLAGTGCHLIQGYYFSKPLSAPQLTNLLRANRPLPFSADTLLKAV